MKKYITPSAEFTKFSTEDIMNTSVAGTEAPVERIVVNGYSMEASNLGEQDFSIFNKQ